MTSSFRQRDGCGSRKRLRVDILLAGGKTWANRTLSPLQHVGLEAQVISQGQSRRDIVRSCAAG